MRSVSGWRRASVALAMGGLLAVTACGTTSENRGGGEGGQQNACGGPDGEYDIGVSQANNAEPYRELMNAEIKAAAAEIPQFNVEVSDAQADNSLQVQQVETFLTKQIDLLIISPNEATPLTEVVKKVYNQGIPVLVLDRKVDGAAYTSFIGADNVAIGRKAGKFFAETLLPDGGKIAELRGLAGSTPAGERAEGFRQGIKGSKVEIVASADGDWLRDKGQQKAEAILKANPDIDAIYSHNDPMGEGARIAADNAGKKDLKIVGIDGLPTPGGGLKAVAAGRLSATFVYPTGAKEAVASAKSILIDCKPVPKEQILKTQLITKENAEKVYAERTQS